MLPWLKPPVFATEEQTQHARVYHTVVWWALLVSTVFLLALTLVLPSAIPRAAFALATVHSTGLAGLAFNRRGRARLASWLFVGGLIVVVAATAPTSGGIRAPGIAVYFAVVMAAGLLLGQRDGLVVAVICALIGLLLAVLEVWGLLPPQRISHTPISALLLYCLVIGLVIVFQRLSTQTVTIALHRAESELRERRQVERERERLLHDLGERVKELQLLHSATKLLQSDRPFNRAVLEDLVKLMPAAWQYPDCCEARIAYGNVEVSTPRWQPSPWQQSAAFATSAAKGVVEVAYLAERPASAEGPFLAEERALLASLADMLVAYLERDHGEQRRRTLEHQLRQSQKMQALGTLAGGIAHDFNNILTAIGGNAELGVSAVPEGHPANIAFNEITRATGRAGDLVKRILVFSRKQEAERKVITLAPVVAEALKLLRASLPPMIRIQATYAPDLPMVYADATQIHQIIMNLGTNAAHAMSGAGGVLAVSVDRLTIAEDESASWAELQPGLHLRLTVRDTGVGMGQEILDRIFEPFFTTKGHNGTGLGLSVVHGIVREHEGAMVVESEVGKGTAFQICFPEATRERLRESDAAPAGPARGNGQHIMYVDDEEAVMFVMTRNLQWLGYRCTGYSNAHEALQAFRNNPHDFDAVVTDMSMPGLTGLDLARALLGIRPDLRVALTSGYRSDESAATEAGIRTLIHKPASLRDLGSALEGMLRNAS